jgi:hypothetical protein
VGFPMPAVLFGLLAWGVLLAIAIDVMRTRQPRQVP